MPLRSELCANDQVQKILLLGSGGLSIGQAGEFDYSGTQAIKALTEEGFEVIVVNPNIATVQTDPAPGVKIYLYPVEAHWVEKIIVAEQPTAIVAGFGGQTALNCLMQLDQQGVLAKHDVLNLGTSVGTLRMTEDRDLFAERMRTIAMPVPPSMAAADWQQAQDAADKIGYPVIVRAAFALGGLGSGFAASNDELQELVETALASSPQVLIEKSLKGWKEVEYEVMRDGEGNIITICNMENFDPLGIHTGDSIVVCPSQTLSDDEYQLLRNAAITIVDSCQVIGECNVQYALDPESHQFYVIEINARLSRSSALASKASGYPIAYIAAKVVLGYDLLELKNPVTGVTNAFFEPALDYVTIKVPRWDLSKFKGASRLLGSTMKSVGEIMAIGRNFPEALQKSIRMVTERGEGLSRLGRRQRRNNELPETSIEKRLCQPTDTRLYVVIEALRAGWSISQIHEVTKIDCWFLAKLSEIVDEEQQISTLTTTEQVHSWLSATSDLDDSNTTDGNTTNTDIARGLEANDPRLAELLETATRPVDEKCWRQWKSLGFGDEQIAYLLLVKDNVKNEEAHSSKPPVSGRQINEASLTIRNLRLRKNVRPVIKKIDTTAAEYPSPSNYLYVTYGGLFDDPLPDDGKEAALVLGGGSYRIGASVEFDWCAVSCSKRLQKDGWRSVIVNCNPETVSTDYNASDRLYFEEMSLERILDIYEFEQAVGIIASMGGQLPNKLALPLAKAGAKLLGHSSDTIDMAEDRSRFSSLLDQLGIDQPRWIAAQNKQQIDKFVSEVGLPVLVRPSYVLSGAAMRVAYDRIDLDLFLDQAEEASADHPVVLSEFLLGAREIELDGVASNGEIVTSIVSEHIENAGVHSGDATMVVPAQKLYVETVRQVRRAGHLIASGLKLNGPFNMQFLARENRVRVIECNARAARSFPFVSKVVGLNLADVATDVTIGRNPVTLRRQEDDLPHVGVKAAMFSFTRLAGADPVLGVEMASTGEVGCIANFFDESFLLAMEAVKCRRPSRGVLVSAGPEQDKLRFLKSAAVFKDLGIPLFATAGTARYLRDHGYEAEILAWPGETSTGSKPKGDVIEAIRLGYVDLVINIPKNLQRQELSHGAQIRMAAVRYGKALITDMEVASCYSAAMRNHPRFVDQHQVRPLPNYLETES